MAQKAQPSGKRKREAESARNPQPEPRTRKSPFTSPRRMLTAPAGPGSAATPDALLVEGDDEDITALPDGEDATSMIEDQPEGDGYASSTPTSSLTWIAWFCSLPGHEYFCEVSEDFIEDDFNLTGLNILVPFWKEAMEMVLDVEPEDTLKIPDVSLVESSAELLYGLVHQRYILTRPGLQSMVEKYEAGHFGTCPRVYCQSCHVAPCGRSDLPGLDTVKLYCPNCHDIYTPPSSRFQGVDGAFFGTTFAHLMFQTYPELAPAPFCPSSSNSKFSPSRSPSVTPGTSSGNIQPSFINPNPHGGQKLPAGRVYTPKIYGFRVSERAKSGPRMQWLRMRPDSAAELDLVDWRGRWIANQSDDYDDESEGEGGPMENFDDDPAADDDDEEEEEEEDEQPAPPSAPSRSKGSSSAVRNWAINAWTPPALSVTAPQHSSSSQAPSALQKDAQAPDMSRPAPSPLAETDLPPPARSSISASLAKLALGPTAQYAAPGTEGKPILEHVWGRFGGAQAVR
ncbi:hypothetical protein BOTBODRAFT_34238 [Botryobasidium botryosum FD-172 SS1]|uniref:Casein kinase II subunit beta n=1 Tax=Botryobasidium botryosum (strain FD-172 SS1) TaxID=930990 RepID=A0A067MAJ7_BOTB1|nr:hypothetical protein BOTBODRAFT_34238 [Botryobasidium botryosum FD-172 SS1]